MAQFQPGQSGNPHGRPVGSRNKVTVAIERLLEERAEVIVDRAIHMATYGDKAMLRLCLDRLYAPRKDRHIPFALPEMNSASDAVKAAAAITAGVAAGELTPSEAAHLSHLVANYAKAIEVEVAERDARLKEKADAQDSGRSPS